MNHIVPAKVLLPELFNNCWN